MKTYSLLMETPQSNGGVETFRCSFVTAKFVKSDGLLFAFTYVHAHLPIALHTLQRSVPGLCFFLPTKLASAFHLSKLLRDPREEVAS